MPPRMSSKAIPPISVQEFASIMKQARPPLGWSSSLAVANSGGPDSTCLIFLLNKYFQDSDSTAKGSPSLVSVTVDHNLQESSIQMANVAEQSARSLGIRHVTSRIPWGEVGFPSKPGPGEPMEERARDARYTALYSTMKGIDANTIAFGHHIDDQVETMLMRLGRGSTILGLAGMSMLSRRGMGHREEEEVSIRWQGYDYMNTWKLRPLLRLSKDRILATCEENRLEYVNDPTNFQPALTIRNAIRDVISREAVLDSDIESASMARYPSHVAEQLISINTHAHEHRRTLCMYLHAGKENLYRSLEAVTNDRVDYTREVDKLFEEKRQRSPPGTILLPYHAFRGIPEVVKMALVWRIMKYVSPSPWGSPRSEGNKRQESVQRLLRILCDDKAHNKYFPISLSIGSRVWWRLVRVKPSGYATNIGTCPPQDLAWLACRLPESRQSMFDPLNIDITPQLRSAYNEWIEENGSPILRFVYDCRFLLTFDLSKLNVKELLGLGSVLVVPRTVWYLPQVVLQTGVSEERMTIHDHIEDDRHSWIQEWNLKKRPQQSIKASGVTTQYFRPITAI